MPDELARAVAVEKRFGDLVAVKSASVAFAKGRIHAVCGENGAGKSTLLKVVAGMLAPDAGHVEAFGSELKPHTPREAIRRGVGMVLQHFALVPVFTALENIVLGAEPVTAGGVIDLGVARARAAKVAKDLGVEIPFDAVVEDLGVGDRQRLEIARALYRDAKLLILDEPTAVLTKGEARALYGTLRRLADAGTAVVVVTHKMDEVRAHADVVTVMRKGALLFTKEIERGDAARLEEQIDEVTAAIMGVERERRQQGIGDRGQETGGGGGESVLEMTDVVVGRALDRISLSVKAREIVGIAGVEGNGQRELVDVIAGDAPIDRGSVRGAKDGQRPRVAVIREDRQVEGLVLDATLRDNIVLGELADFAKTGGILDLGALESEAKKRVEASGAPTDLDRTARTLSGGNQQKIVVARTLARLGEASTAKASVLVAAQPTRGVDLGASKDIHERLRAAARDGAGVLVLSADLDELRSLCHRILVIARGSIVAELPPTATDEEIGKQMLGLAKSAGGPHEGDGAA